MNNINLNIEGWMSEEELIWLYEQAEKSYSVLEVGSWKGRSTYALLSGCVGFVCAVDHWKGNPEEVFMLKECEDDKVYKEFIKNTGHFKNLEIARGESVEVSERLKGMKYDMVFIDGGHTYEQVKKDLEAWGDSAVKLICGHDYDFPDVKKAVDEKYKIDDIVGSIWYKHL